MSRVGTDATTTVVLLDLARESGSPAAVGLLGGLQAPAIIAAGLYGGILLTAATGDVLRLCWIW